MILILVQGSDALTVHNDNINLITICCGSFNGRAPAPESLGTGVDSWAYSKAATLVQKHSIEEVGLTGPVETCDGDDSKRFLDFAEEIGAIGMNLVLWMIVEKVLPYSVTLTRRIGSSTKFGLFIWGQQLKFKFLLNLNLNI